MLMRAAAAAAARSAVRRRAFSSSATAPPRATPPGHDARHPLAKVSYHDGAEGAKPLRHTWEDINAKVHEEFTEGVEEMQCKIKDMVDPLWRRDAIFHYDKAWLVNLTAVSFVTLIAGFRLALKREGESSSA